MRTFYIFKINNEFSKLLKYKPFNLYMILNGIKSSSIKNIQSAYAVMDNLNDKINKNELNNLFNQFYELDGYQRYANKHSMYDYINRSSSKLYVYNSYIVLKTNTDNSLFFSKLIHIPNLFVCDFENNDYFWLGEIRNITLV